MDRLFPNNTTNIGIYLKLPNFPPPPPYFILYTVRVYIEKRPAPEGVDLFMMSEKRLLSFAFTAENGDDFVLVELLHLVASRTEIFAGIELCGLLVEDLTHSGCHGKTAV